MGKWRTSIDLCKETKMAILVSLIYVIVQFNVGTIKFEDTAIGQCKEAEMKIQDTIMYLYMV